MGDTKRTILAGFFIAALTLLIPFYLQFVGVSSVEKPLVEDDSFVFDLQNKTFSSSELVSPLNVDAQIDGGLPFSDFKERGSLSFSVLTNKYNAVLSNVSGGSFRSFQITDRGPKSLQYVGGYDDSGFYDDSLNVELLGLVDFGCNPCLQNLNTEEYVDIPFSVLSPVFDNNHVFSLEGLDSLVVVMEGVFGNKKIIKTTTFFGDNYIIKHEYLLLNNSSNMFGVVWSGGIKTTEKNLSEELTYSEVFLAQNKKIEGLQFTPSDKLSTVDRVVVGGLTDWVAMRSKYFINSLISNQSSGGVLGGVSYQLNETSFIPQYSMRLDFRGLSTISVNQYFGPLDVDLIEQSNTYLDRVMNFGWLPIQPFSRLVLWILKTLRLVGFNYGVILILFAFFIRLLTGPLTKKSFQSSQKMQSVQPKMKTLQEKHKNNSQRLNQEMIKLYKKEGVNPMGGCLPMLIQMPLLFSLFIVFRSTIEFRGAPFFLWITDLSQPDVLFNLPFYIPIYGSHVGFLPVVLGVSMFLSQRLSMSTMDPKQKPMMYFMTAFFFLLFNQFPSGLNLYYTMYNILNYFQQKSLKKV